jgi:hypothetical protein
MGQKESPQLPFQPSPSGNPAEVVPLLGVAALQPPNNQLSRRGGHGDGELTKTGTAPAVGCSGGLGVCLPGKVL